MSDIPPPILTDGVWAGDANDQSNWTPAPRRNRRRRRRGPVPLWLKYVGWCFGLAIVVTAGQIAFHAVQSDPRDARTFAERQLRLSTLRPNEQVVAEVNVWQRPAIDYFRATRGLIVLTSAKGDSVNPIGGRIIYLGLQPRDPVSPRGAPPTFDERDWALDTLVTLTPTRTLFLLARALRVSAPHEQFTVGVPSPSSADADVLLAALNKKYAAIRAVGWQRREDRRARNRASLALLYEERREWYHTVRSGEALASIARMFNTTPDEVRTLNGLAGDKIRAGMKLKVKALTKKPVTLPAGVRPEEK